MGTGDGAGKGFGGAPDELDDLSVDELVAEVRHSEELRRAGRERTGRLLAHLYSRGVLSWPAISRLTGLRQTTAFDLARPYLRSDDES